MGTCIQYNDALFRQQIPAYSDPTAYPQATVQNWWTIGTDYVSNNNGGCYTGGLKLASQTYALNLMAAHLLYLSTLVAAGETPQIVTGAGIDKVNVTLEPPPAKNMWQYWLASSPYGMQLLALLQVASVGGFFVGGVPALTAFRR